jgi:Uma2 family endonuclease
MTGVPHFSRPRPALRYNPAMMSRATQTETGALLEGVSWDYYVHSRDQLPDTVRITFYKGKMEIMMSPTSYAHDFNKTLIGDMLRLYAMMKGIELTGSGSTMLSRDDVHVAIEPDEAFYVDTAPPAGLEEIDLQLHGPPDLAVEVEISRSALNKEPAYAELGVRELWRWNRSELQVRVLRADRTGYENATESTVIPGFPVALLLEHLLMTKTHRQTAILKSWVSRISNPPAP